MTPNQATSDPDVVLVGAGIMCATLGVFLKELEPALTIEMVETLDGAALDDERGDLCGIFFIAEFEEGSFEFALAHAVDERGGGLAARRVHPHIERTFT